MNDHDPCPRCKFENARCACPKSARRKPLLNRDQRQQLAESVSQAIKARKEATT